MIRKGMLVGAMWFQSTPVIANGRIGLTVSLFWTLNRSFNPRPLLLTGESMRLQRRQAQAGRFQSTPVIANGRISYGA